MSFEVRFAATFLKTKEDKLLGQNMYRRRTEELGTTGVAIRAAEANHVNLNQNRELNQQHAHHLNVYDLKSDVIGVNSYHYCSNIYIKSN